MPWPALCRRASPRPEGAHRPFPEARPGRKAFNHPDKRVLCRLRAAFSVRMLRWRPLNRYESGTGLESCAAFLEAPASITGEDKESCRGPKPVSPRHHAERHRVLCGLEEQRESLRQEARAAHEHFMLTGLHLTGEEVDGWLDELA